MPNVGRSRTRKSVRASNQQEEEYEVETILNYRKIKDTAEYYIKWKNYGDSDNQWIAESDLNCESLVKRFWSIQTELNACVDENQVKKAKLDMTEIKPSKLLHPGTFDYDLKQLLEKYNGQWRLKQSESDGRRKTLVKIPGSTKPTGQTLNVKPIVTAEQKLKLDQTLKVWIDDVNAKNQRYSLKSLFIENNFDLTVPPKDFQFIVENQYATGIEGHAKELLVGCTCEPLCSVKSECCPQGMDSEFAYRGRDRLRADFTGKPIFECNSTCKCDINCANRTVQRRRQIELCIFRTSDCRGWGVKSLESIRQDTFVIEYVGEVISSEDADRRYVDQGAEYLFDLDFHDADPEYVIDATKMGNESHFVNHSCDPNLRVHAAFIDTLDIRLPRIALFACRDIAAGDELTFDYSMAYDMLKDESNGGDTVVRGRVKCLCGAAKCRGFVFVEN